MKRLLLLLGIILVANLCFTIYIVDAQEPNYFGPQGYHAWNYGGYTYGFDPNFYSKYCYQLLSGLNNLPYYLSSPNYSLYYQPMFPSGSYGDGYFLGNYGGSYFGYNQGFAYGVATERWMQQPLGEWRGN